MATYVGVVNHVGDCPWCGYDHDKGDEVVVEIITGNSGRSTIGFFCNMECLEYYNRLEGVR